MSPKGSHPKKASLIVLCAPSGTGKSTLAGMLLKKFPELKLSISYTTRPPRGEEKHGIHYFFVNDAEFKSMIKRNEFIEYAHVFGKNWYGTSKKVIEENLAAGQSIIFDIDVEGASNLKKSFPKECLTIFILPPSFEELEARLRNRATESDEAIALRLATAKKEMAISNTFDFQIVNNDLEKTFLDLEALLKKRGCL